MGVETQARQVKEGTVQKKKKTAAACVNWLMLPPLCQINSTGQGGKREGGEECEWGAGFSPFIKGPFFPPSLSFSVWGSANSRVGNPFCDCMSRSKRYIVCAGNHTWERNNKLCPKWCKTLCINHTRFSHSLLKFAATKPSCRICMEVNFTCTWSKGKAHE